MAVAFQSKQNLSWQSVTGGETRDYTLPTGTASGDLLICAIYAYSNTNMSTTPTGWVDIASFATSGSSSRCIKVGYIVATPTLVTAGQITLALTTTQIWTLGIQRWTGQDTVNPISASQAMAIGGNNDHVITPGITPTADNAFAAFGVCQGQHSWDTCVMATSDPTFVNDYSNQTSLGTDAGGSGFHSGVRASAAATGNITLHTTTSPGGDSGGVIVAIQPPQPAASKRLALLGIG